jgi:ATP-dependent RNA helicase DDX24/MAK5
MKGHKRKVVLKHPTSRKKVKTQHNSTNDLPWKAVSRPFQAGTSADDGILEFEEVDNVEVVYEETSNGRVARFNVSVLSFLHFIDCGSLKCGIGARES